MNKTFRLKIPVCHYEVLETLGKSLGLSAQSIGSQAILGLLERSGGVIDAPMPGGIKKSVWIRFSDKEVRQIRQSRYIIASGGGKPLGHMCARLLASALNGEFDMKYFDKSSVPYKDRPRYCGWKLKPIAIWSENEFWGYYLAEYFRATGRDDHQFEMLSEKGTSWAKRRIGKFAVKACKDNAELKEYMDWYFDFRRRQIGGEFKHWTAPVVSFNDLFGKTSPFWKTFLLHKTGYNVYTSSKFESEGAALFRKSNEYGSVEYWNKRGPKTKVTLRDKLWMAVLKFRRPEMKARGIDVLRYHAEYDSPNGCDWKVFDKTVPPNEQLSEENFSEWLYKAMDAIRGETP